MSAGAFPSEPHTRDAAAARTLGAIRAVGRIGLSTVAREGSTYIASLDEAGGFRLKFPAVEGPWLEAVQLNTGGGIAGGDRLAVAVEAGMGSDAIFATQAPERIYRALGDASQIAVSLRIARAARLDWLPQETLLYSGARLDRRFEIDIADDARLTMAEAITFGRAASGETLGEGLLRDTWRVRRGGRLVFAEGLRLDGDITRLLARPAVGRGARACALLLHIAPDASDRLNGVREALVDARSVCGAGASNGILVARFLGGDPGDVRRDVRSAASVLTGRPLPRVWQ
jgi:urease accessory protein